MVLSVLDFLLPVMTALHPQGRGTISFAFSTIVGKSCRGFKYHSVKQWFKLDLNMLNFAEYKVHFINAKSKAVALQFNSIV